LITVRNHVLAGMLLLGGTLAGCASPPPPVLLALPPAATAPARQQPGGLPHAVAGPRLVVSRVALPEYLLVRRVRYRVDASTLAEWPRTFWAERIEAAVTRELAAALRDALPGWSVCEATCPDRAAGLRLQLELAPLDYVRPARRLVARARATLSSIDPPARTLLATELSFEQPDLADTPQAQAQAITELLRLLAQALVPALQAAPLPPVPRP
jgi:uncharacterized lipoprotein YmbA